ncbi:hypothetical protein ACHAWF_013274, partial [Thalassiosira exigua]
VVGGMSRVSRYTSLLIVPLVIAIYNLGLFLGGVVGRSLDSSSEERVEEIFHRTNDVFISPTIRGENSDWGGVPSICSSWVEVKSRGKHVAGVVFKNSDWMCSPAAIGNKLGLYFQSRTFAALQGISFHISPPCPKENDNLIAWLPQNVLSSRSAYVLSPSDRRNSSWWNITREGLCNCGGPIAHQCPNGWPDLAVTWRDEIRSALERWASENLSVDKSDFGEGVATIHFRCGDMLGPAYFSSGQTGHMGFLMPMFYFKHLKHRDIKTVHILTSPLDQCKHDLHERRQDCRFGPSCARIAGALIENLSRLMNLTQDDFQIHDHETVMFSMHHIVFSEITFCSPSTFCMFASMGSNHVVFANGGFTAFEDTIPSILKSYEFDQDSNGFLSMSQLYGDVEVDDDEVDDDDVDSSMVENIIKLMNQG